MLLHIGVDDTDSPTGGCTTYIAALIVEELLKLGCKFVDYPIILRLNPNAPWKTRGNGAICLRVEFQSDNESDIKRSVIDKVESQSEFQCDNTNPGIVFLEGAIPDEVKNFSDRVVQTIVDLKEAESLISSYCASAIAWKNRRGLIGALATIGGTLEGDHTFELLTYRKPENRGSPRRLNHDSILRMNYANPETFNNIDEESGQILIAPRGLDPVLYGVRGETPEAVYTAHCMIVSNEPLERWMIFRTNQGTDVHLRNMYNVAELKPRHPSIVVGHVSNEPKTIIGGHVIFTITDDSGSLDCTAYEPTGSFRNVASSLINGDELICAGGVRDLGDKFTLNLERIEIAKLAKRVATSNPRCPKCSGPTESMGKNQGFRCKKCGTRDSSLKKIEQEIERSLRAGIYIPPTRAHRHLTKPKRRFGKERQWKPVDLYTPWHG